MEDCIEVIEVVEVFEVLEVLEGVEWMQSLLVVRRINCCWQEELTKYKRLWSQLQQV